MVDVINSIDRIASVWNQKKGLLFSVILIISLYLLFISIIDIKLFSSNYYYITPILLILFILLNFVVWLSTTNRFFIKNHSKITAGIMIIHDNQNELLVANKIITKIITNVNDSILAKSINLKILPPNSCTTVKQINKYHSNYYPLYDVLIRIIITSGNINSIEQIEIEDISITFLTKSKNGNNQIFYNELELIKDMNLQFSTRDWKYLTNNSSIDQKKYLANIYHIVLYYIGIYSFYIDKSKTALIIMLNLFNRNEPKIEISNDKNNKIIFNLKPLDIANARLKTILVDLYFYNALKVYNSKDKLEGINLFKQLEIKIPEHPFKFDQYINMSRWSYEVNNLSDAKLYTSKAKLLNKNSVRVNINEGFFAILDDDVNQFYKSYFNVYKKHTTEDINWVDILDFLLIENEKYSDKTIYFKFSIVLIEYLFIKSTDKSSFLDTIVEIKENKQYNKIYELGQYILKNEIIKENKTKPSKKKYYKRNK